MSLQLTKGRVPPLRDGYNWHYEITPGVLLKAMTEELLIKLIHEYRMRNNLPIGDIERDIDAYYCQHWANFCQDSIKPLPSRESLLSRVTRWAATLAAKMPRGGFSLVTQDEADRRSGICFQCPKNVPWKTGCAGCSATTSTLLSQLRQLRTSNRQGNLMACQVTGADNLTAVHLPLNVWQITDEQKSQMPEACWRR